MRKIAENTPLVSVIMITYMHEAFIAEAIEGVLMQEVDFPVELIIADDCSPDQTSQIVKTYIETHPNGHWISYTRHERNKGMMPNFVWALEQASGEFIAICDGDDYWVDKGKIKNQYDYLMKHKYAVLVYANCLIYKNDDLTENLLLPYKNDFSFTLYDYLSQKYYTASPTLFFRNNLPSYKSEFFLKSPIGDEFLVSSILKKGRRAVYLHKAESVYRMHNGGVFSLQQLIKQLYYKLRSLDLLKSELSNDQKAVEIINEYIFSNIDRLYNYTFDGFHGLYKWEVFKLIFQYKKGILVDYRFYYNWFFKRFIGK